jgi:large subunit ribosomal protein L29
MKAVNLREQTDDELRQGCRDMQKEVFDLRVRKKVGEGSGQPLRIRTLRRDVARARTILRERGVKS